MEKVLIMDCSFWDNPKTRTGWPGVGPEGGDTLVLEYGKTYRVKDCFLGTEEVPAEGVEILNNIKDTFESPSSYDGEYGETYYYLYGSSGSNLTIVVDDGGHYHRPGTFLKVDGSETYEEATVTFEEGVELYVDDLQLLAPLFKEEVK